MVAISASPRYQARAEIEKAWVVENVARRAGQNSEHFAGYKRSVANGALLFMRFG